jgi:hypothetical protein
LPNSATRLRSISCTTISAASTRPCESRQRWRLVLRITFGVWRSWSELWNRLRRRRHEKTDSAVGHHLPHLSSLCDICRQAPWFVGSSIFRTRMGCGFHVGQIAQAILRNSKQPTYQNSKCITTSNPVRLIFAIVLPNLFNSSASFAVSFLDLHV